MSAVHTRSLLYKITNDSKAMARIAKAPTFEARVEVVVELGRGYGLDVSHDTVRSFLSNKRDELSGEPLSDADLKSIAGDKVPRTDSG